MVVQIALRDLSDLINMKLNYPDDYKKWLKTLNEISKDLQDVLVLKEIEPQKQDKVSS